MSPDLWYFTFIIILALYLIVMLKVKNKRRYLAYFLAGCFLGFYFDFISVIQNYYTYHPYPPTLYGVPLTVTIAEGFSVVITIYLYEFLKTRWNKVLRGKVHKNI